MHGSVLPSRRNCRSDSRQVRALMINSDSRQVRALMINSRQKWRSTHDQECRTACFRLSSPELALPLLTTRRRGCHFPWPRCTSHHPPAMTMRELINYEDTHTHVTREKSILCQGQCSAAFGPHSTKLFTLFDPPATTMRKLIHYVDTHARNKGGK